MSEPEGWTWFAELLKSSAGDYDRALEDRDLAKAFARCFLTTDGERVLAHLRAMTIDRALGPGVSGKLLRHVEGQRQLVFHILGLIERGRSGA